MGKYASKIKTLEEALKDKSGLSESQVSELEAGLKKFKEMEEADTKKAESKPAAKKKAPAKKNKSHKKAAEPAKAPEKKKIKHKKVSEKRKKHIEKREAKKKNKSHKAAPAKKKVVHKKQTPKRAAAIAKRTEKKAAKHHKPAHHEHKPAGEKTINHRIDSIVDEVRALKPEIASMEHAVRRETEDKMREKLRKTLAETFESGGSVKGESWDLFDDLLFVGGEKFGSGGKVKEGTQAAAMKKHPHVKLKKGYRLPHGVQAPKGDKNKQYSEGNNVKPDKGFFVRGGLETVKGAKKDKFYEDGGSPKKKGGNPNFKPSYGIFTDKAKAEAQAKAKNGIIETLKAKTVPAHTKKKRDKSTGEMREVHHKERHYPVRYMVKAK